MFKVSLLILILCSSFYIVSPIPFGLENYDSYELITAMHTGGVAHPPGYGTFLQLNRWFYQLIRPVINDPSLSMTYFQFICIILALTIGLRLVVNRKGDGIQFILLMLACGAVVENLYSVEVYGFLLLLYALCLYLYCEKISFLGITTQDVCLSICLGFLVSHHLSMAPLGICILLRCFLERGWRITLILGFLIGPLTHCYFTARASQTSMNPWFDGLNLWQLISHLSARNYRDAFLDFGIHLDSINNFISVWSLVIWFFVFIFLIALLRKNQFAPGMGIILVLIWPLFAYHIPDIAHQLVPLYFTLGLLVAGTKKSRFLSLLLTIAAGVGTFLRFDEFKSFETDYRFRSKKQCLHDAQVAVAKSSEARSIFIGYDSTFAIAYWRHVLQSENSTKVSILPMWWLSAFEHLQSSNNYKYNSEGSIHWTALKTKDLIKIHELFQEKFGVSDELSSAFSRLLRVLKILRDDDIGIYIPSGKPALLEFLRNFGFDSINQGWWTKIIYRGSASQVSQTIIQRVYCQKQKESNYFVHVLFLQAPKLPLNFVFRVDGQKKPFRQLLSGDDRIILMFSATKVDNQSTVSLEVFESSGSLLSTVELLID